MDDIFSINILKDKVNGLGFTVKKSENKPCIAFDQVFSNIKKENIEKIHKDDRILRVNNIDFTDISFKTANEILDDVKIGSSINLTIKRSNYLNIPRKSSIVNRFRRSIGSIGSSFKIRKPFNKNNTDSEKVVHFVDSNNIDDKFKSKGSRKTSFREFLSNSQIFRRMGFERLRSFITSFDSTVTNKETDNLTPLVDGDEDCVENEWNNKETKNNAETPSNRNKKVSCKPFIFKILRFFSIKTFETLS